jgi:uncharacterized protein YkwD
MARLHRGYCSLVVLLACSLSLFGAHNAGAVSLNSASQPGALTPRAFLPIVYAPRLTPPSSGDWLSYLNYLRALANLPAVTNNAAWSDGAWKHSRYMVKNNTITHAEVATNPWYTPEGATAGSQSNVAVYSSVSATDTDFLKMWMTGPFHGVAIIDPALLVVGYGSYREATTGTWKAAATLNVLTGLGDVPASVTFPVRWPANSVTTYLRSYTGGEMPDPLSSCAGYATPTGAPIYLQLSSGTVVPSVTAHTLSQGGTPLEHCEFDQTNYVNNTGYQSLGRSVLAMRSAIVLLPRSPLVAGNTYNVSITTNGQTYAWSFSVGSAASASAPVMAARSQ